MSDEGEEDGEDAEDGADTELKNKNPTRQCGEKTIVWRQQLLKTMFCDLTHIHETP